MRYLKTMINRLESFITSDKSAERDTPDRLVNEDEDFARWIRMVLSRLDQMEREDNE